MDNLKLFVWPCLKDYTDGIAFALAENVDEARWLILQQPGCPTEKMMEDISKEPEAVYSGKMARWMWGGA